MQTLRVQTLRAGEQVWEEFGGLHFTGERAPLFLREPGGGVCSVNGALSQPLGPLFQFPPRPELPSLHCFSKRSPRLMVFVISVSLVIFSRRPLPKNRLILHRDVCEIVFPEPVALS